MILHIPSMTGTGLVGYCRLLITPWIFAKDCFNFVLCSRFGNNGKLCPLINCLLCGKFLDIWTLITVFWIQQLWCVFKEVLLLISMAYQIWLINKYQRELRCVFWLFRGWRFNALCGNSFLWYVINHFPSKLFFAVPFVLGGIQWSLAQI